MIDNYTQKNIDESIVLKERLRDARDARKSLTNQEIADRSGLTLATVNNFFSNRTKSSSAFTVGRLCRALGVSMDDVFGIVPAETPAGKTESEKTITELKAQCREKDTIIALKNEEIRHYSAEIARWKPIVRSVVFLCVMLAVMLMGYLAFDITNPNFGLFRG